jgi:hypothetical protein
MSIMRTLCTAVASLLMAGTAAHAAQPGLDRVDPRWHAWLGCWQLLDESVRDADDPYATPEFTPVAGASVCVTPGTTPDTVSLTTEVDAQAVLADTIVADGATHPAVEPGCSGWRQAQWSASGRRLYVRAELSCTDGVRRVVSGLTTISPGAVWVDVQVVERAGRERIEVRKYRRAGDQDRALQSLTRDDLARAAVAAARQSVPLTLAEIPEASAALVPTAVEAALVETGASFPITAERLAELSDAGVPGRVIDLMVALSFPRHFVIERRAGPRPASARGGLAGGIGTTGWYDPYGFPYYYAPLGFGYWGGSDAYYYGAPVFYSGPVVGEPQPSGEGRVVDGLGYTRVRSRDPAGPGTLGGSTGGEGGGGGSGSSAGGVTSQGYSGGGDSGRTAVSRPPG